MKAVIPVAGTGKRLRPHTYSQPKPLIPVAGKPIIAFIIDEMVANGVDEIIFIIGYLGEKIKDYVSKSYPDLKTVFVTQEETLGSGHAIWMAKEYIQDEKDCLIVLGDTVFEADIKEMLSNPLSCLAIKRVEDPREFGVVELGSNGEVLRVIEKPKIPKSNMALVGLYKISAVKELMEALEFNIKNDIRTIGEFHLTDGIARMIDGGVDFRTQIIHNWFDCGKKEILLETNAMLLAKQKYNHHESEEFETSIIIHPVSIGKNCKVMNSIIGPNVSIGDGTTVESTIIKDSIIGSNSVIEEAILQKSVVGNDTAIRGLRQSLNLGDNTEIDFNHS
jgi:glucose-1-phosphate thymidylyltransferase